MTIYSESAEELSKTLDGIYDNLFHFKRLNMSDEDMAVVVIFDGCKPVHGSKTNLYKIIKIIYMINDICLILKFT